MLFAWFSLLFLLDASPQAPPSNLPDSAKCAIEGVVVKAATGEPLRKARVILQKEEKGEPHPQVIAAVTDATGRFALKDVEPGRYRFWAERDGYVNTQYGQRSFQRPGGPLNLAPGQRLRDVVFRMVAGAVISGRIFDDDGEPLAWANVQVLRTVYAEGRRRLARVNGMSTNDLGEYRLWGLPPGRYVLGATYAPGSFYGWTGGASASRPTRLSATEELFGATYYPGTADVSRASVIELHPGEEVSRMDITLLRVHTFHLRGRVVNAVTSQSARNASVWLEPRNPGSGPILEAAGASVNGADGTFEVRGVLPGSYNVVARLYDEGQEFSAHQPVEVGKTDVEGLQLVITSGVDLPGRIRIEGSATPLTKLNIWLRPKENWPGGGFEASVKEDGSFLLKNVNGDGELIIFQEPESQLPGDFFLKSARLGEDDVLDKGLSASRAGKGDTLEVVLSSAGGHVDGNARNKDGQGVGGAAVVLIPQMRSASRLYKPATADQNGHFILRGIAPGEYKLFAWEDIEAGAYRDPDFLRPYEDRGEELRVEENGRYSVELKVIPADSTSATASGGGLPH